MASERAIKRLQQLIWVLIYGGLFAVVLGIALRRNDADASLGTVFVAAGAVVAAAGAVLIYVRSRLEVTQ